MIHHPAPMSGLDLVAAARKLAPEIRARTTEIEEARRIPADLSARLAEAGFYRAFVPELLGGEEMHPGLANAGIEELARSDASVAWVAFIGMTSGSALAGIPEAAAREIFARPDTLVTGVFAPMGRADREGDAYRARGRWSWGSGSDNADWILAGCRLFAGGEPERTRSGAQRSHMLLLPREEVDVLGNWNASGLCGSGSGDTGDGGSRPTGPAPGNVSWTMPARTPWVTVPRIEASWNTPSLLVVRNMVPVGGPMSKGTRRTGPKPSTSISTGSPSSPRKTSSPWAFWTCCAGPGCVLMRMMVEGRPFPLVTCGTWNVPSQGGKTGMTGVVAN